MPFPLALGSYRFNSPHQVGNRNVRKLWSQIHWFLGITAGIVLAVVGVTGGLLSFEHEILRAINPGVMTVAPQPGERLTPQQLIERVGAAQPQRRIVAVEVSAEPDHAARVGFAPPQQADGGRGAGGPPGRMRTEWRYVDPYSGALLGQPRGQEFFRTTMQLHRWLLAGDVGKQIVGASTVALIVLSISGIYLRWPRRPLDWRAWLRLDMALKGRSFLWHLHAVVGVWVLLFYLLAGLTGLYWSYEWYRNGLYAISGVPQPTRGGGGVTLSEPAGAPDLAVVWNSFLRESGSYSTATFTLPQKPDQALEVRYFDADPAHERASNRLVLHPISGEVLLHDRYADRPLGVRLMGSMLPLHSGSYFGVVGTTLMMIASLLMPLFTVTGWVLYLDRRAKKRAARAARPAPTSAGAAAQDLLIAFASQTGFAERLAWQTAASLQAAGVGVTVSPLDKLDESAFSRFGKALFVVSTFGDGEAPDNARGFARRMARAKATLDGLRFGLLALGDRQYTRFCGFGRTLDDWLRRCGAQPLFEPVEMDKDDPAALQRWQRHLAELSGAELPAWSEPEYQRWRLVGRRELNPGSAGAPTFLIELEAPQPQSWQAGDLAEIVPRHPAERVAAFLQAAGLDGNARVERAGKSWSLGELLARSQLPAPEQARGRSPQQLADTLAPLPYRQYSIASLPGEGRLRLLVRQVRHDGGYGLGSGWLTVHAPEGADIELRLVANANFRLDGHARGRPLILIGNGTGLAGLRVHLKARIDAGERRNWLLFGERNERCDFYFGEEIRRWLAEGKLARLDLAFSRDQSERVYVQHRLRQAGDEVRAWLAEGAVVCVCGDAQGMAPAVHEVLKALIGPEALERLAQEGRYRRDVY